MMGTKTIVGLPRVCTESQQPDDHEPFPLRSRRVPLCERDMRGLCGRQDVHIPPARRVITQVRLRVPAPSTAPGALKEFCVAAAIVFALGSAMIGWLL